MVAIMGSNADGLVCVTIIAFLFVGFAIFAFFASRTMYRQVIPDAVVELQREVKRLRSDVERLMQAEDERLRDKAVRTTKEPGSDAIVADEY